MKEIDKLKLVREIRWNLAGGFDFFKVTNPEKYASNWLDFIGNLYSEIENEIYETEVCKQFKPRDGGLGGYRGQIYTKG